MRVNVGTRLSMVKAPEATGYKAGDSDTARPLWRLCRPSTGTQAQPYGVYYKRPPGGGLLACAGNVFPGHPQNTHEWPFYK